MTNEENVHICITFNDHKAKKRVMGKLKRILKKEIAYNNVKGFISGKYPIIEEPNEMYNNMEEEE